MVKDEDPIVVYERVPPCPGHDDRCVIVIFIVSPPFRGTLINMTNTYNHQGNPMTIFV